MSHAVRPAEITGCLLGGAVGDALGAPVEFDSLQAILARFGPNGIGDFAPAYGRVGAITDDTQMTLFTAEGLVRAQVRQGEQRDCHVPSVVHHAYLRWLRTQGEASSHPLFAEEPDGWLIGVEQLHSRRAPGNSCLSALCGDRMGTIDEPVNNSKGCGGVMRIAPVGLVAADPFQLGCEVAAITHGHPTGYLAAGFLACVIHGLAQGHDLREAIDKATVELKRWPRHEECLVAVEAAVSLAASAKGTAEEVETLGQGWVAEEALSISLFCALVAQDFAHGVLLAVNHGGDSDSTGAITGSILGTALGSTAIPARWLDRLELRDVTEGVAVDLVRHCCTDGLELTDRDRDRYPGW